MTNFEYYAEDIKAVGYYFAIKKDGEFVSCLEITCGSCIFCEDSENCTYEKIKWLYEEYKEHIEQPKLTQNERKLCEILQNDYYVARDKSGTIYVYAKKPHKKEKCNQWFAPYDEYYVPFSDYVFKDCNFSFIKWEDEEPWAISDLLKLEVME